MTVDQDFSRRPDGKRPVIRYTALVAEPGSPELREQSVLLFPE